MRGKMIVFVAWSITCIVAFILEGVDYTKDRVYTGISAEFSISRNKVLQISDKVIQIDDDATFQAASPEFFVFRKESGETIVGVPMTPPLGWSGRYFFVSQEIQRGRWLVPDAGTVFVKITNQTPTTIRLVENHKNEIWIADGMITFILWFMVFVFVM